MTAPSISDMTGYLDKWNNTTRLVSEDRVLRHMFAEVYPRNNTIDEVLPKVVAINGLYNTRLRSVYEMAQHIVSLNDDSLNVDSMLVTGDPIIVDKIAKCSFNGNCISFASKYCSFSQPEKFVIYDSRVRNLLWVYKNELGISYKKDLASYLNYKKAIDDFQIKYELIGKYREQPITYKLLDQYLWLLADDLRR